MSASLSSSQRRISPLGPICAVQPVKWISCKGVKLSRLREFSWFKLDVHVRPCLKNVRSGSWQLSLCSMDSSSNPIPPNYSSYTCIEATRLFFPPRVNRVSGTPVLSWLQVLRWPCGWLTDSGDQGCFGCLLSAGPAYWTHRPCSKFSEPSEGTKASQHAFMLDCKDTGQENVGTTCEIFTS